MRGVLLLVLVGALAVPASAAAADERVAVRTEDGYATVTWSGGWGGTAVRIVRGTRGAVVVSSPWLATGEASWRTPVRLQPGRYTAVLTGGCPPAGPGQVACLGLWSGLAEFVVAPYRAFRGGTHLSD